MPPYPWKPLNAAGISSTSPAYLTSSGLFFVDVFGTEATKRCLFLSQAQKLKSNSTVDGVFCVVSTPLRLIKHLFLWGPAHSSGSSHCHELAFQRDSNQGDDLCEGGTAVLRLLLILLKVLQLFTYLPPRVTRSITRRIKLLLSWSLGKYESGPHRPSLSHSF